MNSSNKVNSLKFLSMKKYVYSLPLFELEELINHIENLKESRNKIAEENYLNTVDRLLKGRYTHPERDWSIQLKINEKPCFIISWYNRYIGVHENKEYTYKLRMTIWDKDIVIEKVLVCKCFSPHFCTGDCYINIETKMGEATYNDDKLDYKIYTNEENIIEWIPKVIKIYKPLIENFNRLVDKYNSDIIQI